MGHAEAIDDRPWLRRRHDWSLIMSATVVSLSVLAGAADLTFDYHEAQYRLPLGMHRADPNVYPPDTTAQDIPRRTIALAGVAMSGTRPHDKVLTYVVAIPSVDERRMVQAGCDVPVLGWRSADGTSVTDDYYINGWSEFSNVAANGEQYAVMGVAADLDTNNVAIGCVKYTGDPAQWDTGAVLLGNGAMPFDDALRMGVHGVT